MKSFLLLTLILPSQAAASEPILDVNVMSFNIQQPYGTQWEQRREISAAILAQQGSDIVGTQEAVAHQRDFLIDKHPGYAWYGDGRDGGDDGEGSWVFYGKARFRLDSALSGNFWLSDSPKSPSRFGGAYNRICTFVHLTEKSTGLGLYVFNAHNYTPELAVYRMRSARMIADAVAGRAIPGDPVLLTGDFNSTESDTVTRWLKYGSDNPTRVRDSYRDVHPTGPVTTGFGTKFDYVYVPDKPEYQALQAWVVTNPAGASDHMPICGTIRLVYPASTALARPAARKTSRVLPEYSGFNLFRGIDGRGNRGGP